MNFIAWIIVAAISFAVGDILRQSTQEKPKKPTPGDIQFPELREGKEYPVLFGTCWVPVCPVWWGDIKTTAIRQKVGSNIDWWKILFGPLIPGHSGTTNSVYQTIGYRYSVGMHLKLLTGQIDGVKQMRFNNITAWPDPDDDTALQADGATTITINQPNLFGGQESEGGIVGTISVQYGGAAQTQNAYLVSKLGSDIPASRGVLGLIFERVDMGTSRYIKTPLVLCKRTDIHTDGSAMWYAAKANINGNLNPVHILRECFTNSQWGQGYSTGLIDETSWQAAADTCYTENFGLSRLWDESFNSLEDFIEEIKRHINCVIYQDMERGKLILKLIRDDYVVGDLETFDVEDIVSLDSFARGSYGKITTSMRVNYWDIIKNKTALSPPINDIAMLQIQNGKMIEEQVDYFGITDEDLATTVAVRDLNQKTSMLAVFTIKTKRTMSHLRPGGVFKLNWVLGDVTITGMVVRILTAKYGTLRDGACEFGCCEDIFHTESAIFLAAPASGWTDPKTDPVDITNYYTGEVPFYTIVGHSGLANAIAFDNDTGFLLAGCSQPSGDSLDYELLLRDGIAEDFYSIGRSGFTPTGTIDDALDMNAEDATIDLSDVEGLSNVVVGDYAVIENEIVKVLSLDAANNQVEVARGCLDTVPTAHNADTRIWFAGSLSFYAGANYMATDQPGVKFLPRTGKGQLDESDATAHNATAFDSRMIRPYPPGNLKINTVSYPASFSGQPTLTWSHRDRTAQIEYIVEHDDIGFSLETAATYTLKIYDEDNNLIRTEPGLTGENYEYTEENERSDCGLGEEDPLNTQLRFILYTVRAGYDSWQSYDLTVPRV